MSPTSDSQIKPINTYNQSTMSKESMEVQSLGYTENGTMTERDLASEKESNINYC